jgi:hypothetical protein
MIALRFASLIALGLALLAGPVGAADNPIERLLQQAEADAPSELQFHIIRTQGRLSSFLSKVRTVEQVPGWQQIRVEGEAAYAAWDALRKDFVWHGGKFEVIYDIIDVRSLKLNSITFNGQTSRADP